MQSKSLFDPRDSIFEVLADVDFQQADRLLESGNTEDEVIRYMRGWALDYEWEAKCLDADIEHLHANQ